MEPRYNPSTDTWTTGNNPVLVHFFGALVHNNGRAYLIGGGGTDTIEEYNMDDDSWSVCDIKVPRVLSNLYAVVFYD